MNGAAEGRRLPHDSESAPIPAVVIEPRVRPGYDRPWTILALLFCATAALGLPLLWYSQSFSRPAKIFWSVVVLLYTVFVLWVFTLIMLWCYGRIAPYI